MPVSLIAVYALDDMAAMARKAPEGCIVEVGVYQGGSAEVLMRIAKEQGRQLFLYDTFTGTPCWSVHDSHDVGDFADAEFEIVRDEFPEATVIKGIFPESAVPMPPIAFVHMDCDQYQSVKESAAFLKPLMVHGGIMWFDDSPCLKGAEIATHELFGNKRLLSSTGKHFVRF